MRYLPPNLPPDPRGRLPESPSRREVLGLFGLAAGGALIGCGGGGPVDEEADSEDVAALAKVRPAPGLGEPRYVDTNGIQMGYYDMGEGTPVVFSHGFPELAYSWRNQMPMLADAGFRAIAPDQRGYGLTERPEPIDAYRIEELCKDMVGLLDALEIERAVFCGHDWGGGVVWMMPRFFPERVAGVIGVNTPAFDPRFARPPEEDPLIVRTDTYYTNTFQEPGVAEAVLERDVRKTFEFFLRRGGIWNVDDFRGLPEDSPERRMDLLAMVEKGNPSGELILSPAELDYFVDTFETTGFTGGLNWYRAAALPPTPEAQARGAEMAWDIGVPCLYVGAEHDVILRPSSADGMEQYVADLEKHTIADCGHWTQQEKPAELNSLLLDWLGRKVV